MKKSAFLFAAVCLCLSFSAGTGEDVQAFLLEYNRVYQRLNTASAEAEWKLNTRIVEKDTMTGWEAQKAKQAYAEFTGSQEVIEKARRFLKDKDKLTPLQLKQLEKILYLAANNPASLRDLVKQRIKAETEQTEKLFGFDFKLAGKSVTTNDLDRILNIENDVAKRLAAWESSKEVGKVLCNGLKNLRQLRNETVRPLGYKDFFSYQVSDYGMSREEMMKLMNKLIKEVYPLYRELHTYARYELAKKYNSEVPEMLPAHWLPNRWGQDWSALVNVSGLNLDSVLKSKDSEWLVRQAERFYTSIGFSPLPATFYERSSLYPVPPGAGYKKNNHASAWHIDLENDVRCLMSVEPSSEWYETVHHEFGHIYYYLSYSQPEVPYLLREGANRAYHEAFGSMLGLAAMQKPFLSQINLLPAGVKSDETQTLLKEALNYIIFIPWSAGVMSEFEHDLYAEDLEHGKFNSRWWELVKKYQGIVPSSARGSEYCDAASKTHINDDAAQYYDYAISYILLFQVHDHIANRILHQDPRATSYYGNREVGKFLEEIMRHGASRDWRQLLIEKTGEDLSARAMLNYFEPLMAYLKKVNEGRKHTLREPD